MRQGKKRNVTFLFGLAAGVAITALAIPLLGASSTEEVSPVKARDRDVYLPNSEDLGPEEMRVIACGTGMPNPRMAQAAACFLVELGNGDKFIFDVGSGSAERLAARGPFR
jgi:ribonuclease Z